MIRLLAFVFLHCLGTAQAGQQAATQAQAADAATTGITQQPAIEQPRLMRFAPMRGHVSLPWCAFTPSPSALTAGP